MPELRVLGPQDAATLDAFLARHADTSMFLRSNARSAGLVDRGQPMQGTYLAALESGRIVGVAAHCWNGVVLVQAPVQASVVARRAVEHSGHTVTGLSGPWSQVVAARAALGLATTLATKDSRDQLYALDLARLVVPAPLATGELSCRRPESHELELLAEWRARFSVEALGATDGAELRRASHDDVQLHHARGVDWVAVRGATPVAYAVFNAALPDMVQIGGVWTPRVERGRGCARAVVAGSLLAARARGVRRAVLFVEPGNVSAQRAYAAIGFEIVGDYGLVLWAG